MVGRNILCAGFAVALLLLSPLTFAAQTTDRITVLAAASLTDALQEIGKAYEASTGRRVAFSFAGSMTLAKQIEASAGADMFISADSESMDYLDSRGLIAKPTRQNLLTNDLVLIAPADSKTTLQVDPSMRLAEALMGGRLAVANTEVVPAGRYGKAALMALGVWDSIKDRLAQGEDVRATLAYVARGEAPLGIVYATDARVEPRVRVVGIFPAATHEPIVYPVALTKDAKPEATAFLAYLKGPQAHAVFTRVGFGLPTP
jgi:molybdate transport system substrate-binding protein